MSSKAPGSWLPVLVGQRVYQFSLRPNLPDVTADILKNCSEFETLQQVKRTVAPRSATIMKWITREKVKVDRVACPWLIKKFLDKHAEFFFVPADKVIADDAVPGQSACSALRSSWRCLKVIYDILLYRGSRDQRTRARGRTARKRLTLERRSNRQSYTCYERKYPSQTRRPVLGCSYCLICPPSNPAIGLKCGAG